MPTTKEVSKEIQEGSRVYEIGVHFLASIHEGEVAKKFDEIKAFLGKQDAEIISEEAPKIKNLAYTMVKHLAGKNTKYNTAYFGWVKFEIASDKIAEIKESLDQNESILRYIIVKTVRENTLHGHKFAPVEAPKREGRRDRNDSPTLAETPERVAETLPLAEVEVDKAIDELVTE